MSKKPASLASLFCLCSFLWCSDLLAQCRDFNCLYHQALDEFNQKNYEKAITSAIAAKNYTGADIARTDSLINSIFQEINALKSEAEKQRKKAEQEAAKAKKAQEEAEKQQLLADLFRKAAEQKKDSLSSILFQIDAFLKKSEDLSRVFSEESAYDILLKTGLEYFEFDSIRQGRDYSNALTYFALARFLKPDAVLDSLIKAAQIGIEADKVLLNGDLTLSDNLYRQIQQILPNNCAYETWRRQNITEVKALFTAFKREHADFSITEATLTGNWWTCPAEFRLYGNISRLTIADNKVNWKKLPEYFHQLPRLTQISISRCPGLRHLDNWEGFTNLNSLTFSDNLNLHAVTGLENLRHLTELAVEDCPVLTTLDGCSSLESFSIQHCPQARVATLLTQNTQLKQAEIENLSYPGLKFGHLSQLKHLTLSDLNESRLNGLNQATHLETLKIDNLDHLSQIDLPSNTKNIIIHNCDSIRDLSNWTSHTSLQNAIFFNNVTLKKLPDWRKCSDLQNLLVQNNRQLTNTGRVKSLKHPANVVFVQNDRIRTKELSLGVSYYSGNWQGYLYWESRNKGKIWDYGLRVGLAPNRYKTVGHYDKNISELALNFDYRRFAVEFAYIIYGKNDLHAGIGFSPLIKRLSYDNLLIYRTQTSVSGDTTLYQSYYSNKITVKTTLVDWDVWGNLYVGWDLFPALFKKDKVSLNFNYSVPFKKPDINDPSERGGQNTLFNRLFGGYTVGSIRYVHILQLGPKTHFIRSNNLRKGVRLGKKNRVSLPDLPDYFERKM